MALSAVKTFVAGEPLFADDLNDMNLNILNNGLSLISPLTGNLDADENSIADLTALGLANAGASTTLGYLQRAGIALTFYDGFRSQYLQNTLLFNKTIVGNVGTGEDDLMTMALEASFFAVADRAIRIVAGFHFAANANNKTLKVKLIGTSSLTLNDATAAPNDVYALADLLLYRPTTDTQYLTGTFATVANLESMPNASWTETETGALTLKFTGEATDNNDIRQLFMYVTLIR